MMNGFLICIFTFLIIVRIGGRPRNSSPRWGPPGYDLDGYHQMRPPQALQDNPVSSDVITGTWTELAQEELRRALQVQPNNGVAKNVILMVGDGMGISTVTAARFFKMQKARHDPVEPRNLTMEDVRMEFEDFPYNALSMTYNTDSLTSDSAGAATALLTGEKTKMSVVGISDVVAFGDCQGSQDEDTHLKSILKHAIDEGKAVGVVTNTRITHATPSATYANSASRYWESDADFDDLDCEDIASQLITNGYAQQFKVIFGGGRQAFFPADVPDIEHSDVNGTRTDGRNLIEEWLSIKSESGLSDEQYSYVWDLDGFNSVQPTETEHVLGLFEPDHMQFETERAQDNTEPSLVQMVEKAILILEKEQNGFILMVEGGRIDHGHHETRAHEALHETVMFDNTVRLVGEMTDPTDTLTVVTADHSHVFTIAGHPTLNNDILDVADNVDGPEWQIDMSGKRWLTLGYTNGPGFFDYRYNMTGVDEEPTWIDMFNNSREHLRWDPGEMDIDPNDPNLRQDAPIPLYSETHGGEDVGIYAQGPMAHLFHGTHEQNYIAHVCMYAACVGPNKEHCTSNSASSRVHTVTWTDLAGIVMLVSLVMRV